MQIYAILIVTTVVSFARVSGQVAPSQLENLVKAGIDPYFVESRDTVSKFGPQCIVRSLLQDKNGNIWFATWQGIMKYDGRVFTNYTLKENLIRFHVLSLFEDKKGNLWFGTVRGGMYRYNARDSVGKSFRLFTTKDGLIDNTVQCFAEDKDGNMWFGTEKGLSRYDGKTFTNFTKENGLSGNNINSIIKDKQGRLWLGGEGITCYGGKSFTKFADKEGKPFKRVASLFEDKDGNIWIGSGAKDVGGKGLCSYDSKSLTEFIAPGFVMYMCEDKKGNLWFAHNKGDINRNFTLYRYKDKAITKIIEQTDPPNNPAIFGIIEDNGGNIWFGTAKGVCRFNPLMADNPCVQKTCKHDLPMGEAVEQHNRELEKAYTFFRK